jgi:hypothetical protein
MIRSLIYLLGLYFTRFIPLKIFWGLYSLAESVRIKIGPKILVPLIILSYGATLFVLFIILLAGLNFSLAHNLQLIWLPLLAVPEKSAFYWKNFNDKNYIFLLSPLLYLKAIVLPLRIILGLLEYSALVAMGFGAVEVVNDYSSHLNPDILDLFFPANGAVLLYGGFAIFVLVSFFLYFVLAPRNLHKWKRRIMTSSRYAPAYRSLIISPALLHPYFFLSPGAKLFCAKRKISSKRIALLLSKAILENRDVISFEWLEKNQRRL